MTSELNDEPGAFWQEWVGTVPPINIVDRYGSWLKLNSVWDPYMFFKDFNELVRYISVNNLKTQNLYFLTRIPVTE
jgi:hypothetical protein